MCLFFIQWMPLQKPITLNTNSSDDVTLLIINSVVKRIQGSVSTDLQVHTNISVFTITVHVYDGKLKVSQVFVVNLS